MVRDADTSRLPQTPDGTFHPATLAFLRAQRRRRRRVSGTFGKWTDAGDVLGDDEASGFALSFEQATADALVRWPDNTAKQFSGDPNDLLTYTSPSTKYVRNSSGVLVPGTTLRTDHLADGTALGLLIEEARTNLFTFSEQFDNAAWTKSNATITADDTAAPDGAGTADKLGDDGSTGTGEVYANQAVTVSTSTKYTLSVYAKQDQLPWLVIKLVGFTTPSGEPKASFDLANGSVGTVDVRYDDSGIETLANGWHRAWVVFTTDATDTGGQVRFLVGDADNDTTVGLNGTSSIYIWGAQLEAGSFPTSYIKTEGSQVTRNADNISLATTEFPFSATESTLIAHWQDATSGTGIVQDIVVLQDGLSESMGIFQNSSPFVVLWCRDGGVNQASLSLGTPLSLERKAACAFKANDFAGSLGGGAVETDTSGTIPTPTSLKLGSSSVSSTNASFWLKSLVYLPRRMSNADLQARTA